MTCNIAFFLLTFLRVSFFNTAFYQTPDLQVSSPRSFLLDLAFIVTLSPLLSIFIDTFASSRSFDNIILNIINYRFEFRLAIYPYYGLSLQFYLQQISVKMRSLPQAIRDDQTRQAEFLWANYFSKPEKARLMQALWQLFPG